MSWEYWFLKNEHGLTTDPLLHLFETFCQRAYGVMDAMEWSWKFQGRRCLANRMFWLGSPGLKDLTSKHLKWLARELSFEPLDLQSGPLAWQQLLDIHTERAAVAYAGSDPNQGRGPVIKLYLTLDHFSAIDLEMLRSVIPKLPDNTPLRDATVILCYVVCENGNSSSRIYVMYNGRSFESTPVCDWLNGLAGERAVSLAKSHIRTGVAFKNDRTDMLGLAFRPTGSNLDDHPSWWDSPVLDPLFYAAGSQPLLRARLRRVSWVTVPLSRAALEFPLEMDELNVYVKLL
jgi:hypothetical protein